MFLQERYKRTPLRLGLGHKTTLPELFEATQSFSCPTAAPKPLVTAKPLFALPLYSGEGHSYLNAVDKGQSTAAKKLPTL